MIPKIIFQTYKDPLESMPKYIQDTAQTWIDKNPDYLYMYFDDAQAEKFILKQYGKEYSEIFKNLPVGVMRGDMFRYLILYKIGGIYTDLDTECISPINDWLLEDKDFIICPETDDHLCQWTIAASPGHPALKGVIDLMMSRLKNPNYDMLHMVHHHTGPAMFTQGVLDGLGLENLSRKNLTINGKFYNESEEFKNNKVHLYSDNRWRIFHFEAVKHLYGSQVWSDGYVQWIRHVK